MTNHILQYVLYLLILVLLAVPLGKYMYHIMTGERTFLSPLLRPVEKGLCKLMRVDPTQEMTWKQYALAAVMFSAFGFLFLLFSISSRAFFPSTPKDCPAARGISPSTRRPPS